MSVEDQKRQPEFKEDREEPGEVGATDPFQRGIGLLDQKYLSEEET